MSWLKGYWLVDVVGEVESLIVVARLTASYTIDIGKKVGGSSCLIHV